MVEVVTKFVTCAFAVSFRFVPLWFFNVVELLKWI